jgi:hypothetical protein
MRPGGSTLLSQVRPGEIWVIQTASADVQRGRSWLRYDARARRAQARRAADRVPLPLRHTDLHAVVTGYISAVDVTQQFENPYDEKIEAVYLFPLPEKAAVNEFVMTIGERKIRGILREKEEAQRIYEDARAQGYRASLLVQHRPNIFEQKVANIEPGKRIDVSIRYFHTLAYEDGWYSFVFPTVVGPRYNPQGSQSPVAALPRDDSRQPANGTAVRYLRPTERSAHDIGISVDVDAGVAIEELTASHRVRRAAAAVARARHARGWQHDSEPRLHLKFRVAGTPSSQSPDVRMTHAAGSHADGVSTGCTDDAASAARRDGLRRRHVGSMSGQPLAQARRHQCGLTGSDDRKDELLVDVKQFEPARATEATSSARAIT